MQYKVPQFIDVEDTIFGPFTFKQFAYLVGGGGLIFIIYKLLPLWIGIFLIIPVAGLTAALVKLRINNQPFIYYLQAGISYFFKSKLYLWKQRVVKPEEKKEEAGLPNVSIIPQVTSGRLKELSWGLDMQSKGDEHQ